MQVKIMPFFFFSSTAPFKQFLKKNSTGKLEQTLSNTPVWKSNIYVVDYIQRNHYMQYWQSKIGDKAKVSTSNPIGNIGKHCIDVGPMYRNRIVSELKLATDTSDTLELEMSKEYEPSLIILHP